MLKNIYENENNRQLFLEKYYTEDGIKALENRLKNLSEVYTKEIKYPFEVRMFGFPMLKIHSKEHHEGMMDELCQILGKSGITIEVN